MAWTITNWANADWSAAATLNEFVNAVNERKSALGQGSPFATVVAGDDVQAATFLKQFQSWIEANRASFVVSHIAGDTLAGGYYDDHATIDAYANLAAVFSGAGLGYSNWRRYTAHPDEAGGVAYGQVQAGDIIGPWIFEDIQKCLNVLVWTAPLPWSVRSSYFGWGDIKGRTDAKWEEVKAIAEAGYAPFGFPVDYGQANSFGELVDLGGVPGYYASLYHVQIEGRATAWDELTRNADWYVNAIKVASYFEAFDDYDDDVIEEKWSLWSQDEPATASTTIVSQTVLGSAAAMPNNPWCGKPVLPTGVNGRGWKGESIVVVVRWNVAGGFAYQA